jgi:hypothetical protein
MDKLINPTTAKLTVAQKPNLAKLPLARVFIIVCNTILTHVSVEIA